MEESRPILIEVDSLDIYVLVDNYVDGGLPGGPGVRRYKLGYDGKLPINSFLAEHALSLILTATTGTDQRRIILDAACCPLALPHNLTFGEIDLNGLESVVISHGHEDHMGALPQLLEKMDRPVRVYAHPVAFHVPRYYRTDEGEMLLEPKFEREWVTSAGGEVIETPGPTLIEDGSFLITGEIPRKTDFEKALPGSLMEVHGQLVPDVILDDQAVVVALKGHGLVVVTGCAHAGVVNTLRYAQDVTGIETIYAVIGGFHLSGDPFQSARQPTVNALRKLDPKTIIPMHCTGAEAKKMIENAFPEQTLISGVGTTFSLPIV